MLSMEVVPLAMALAIAAWTSTLSYSSSRTRSRCAELPRLQPCSNQRETIEQLQEGGLATRIGFSCCDEFSSVHQALKYGPDPQLLHL